MAAPIVERRNFWAATCPELEGGSTFIDRDVDVVIVGGGVAGLTAALSLRQRDLTVLVAEREAVAGAGGRAGGWATVLPGPVYADLVDEHGADAGLDLVHATSMALDFVDDASANIDCGRRWLPLHLTSDSTTGSVELQREVAAANRAGLPVEFLDDSAARTHAPFATGVSARIDSQLAVHPARYCRGLAQLVRSVGGFVAPSTNVTGVGAGTRSGARFAVDTTAGRVGATSVMLAGAAPCRRFAGAELGPLVTRRAAMYAAAVGIERAIDGMYYGVDAPTWTAGPAHLGTAPSVVVGEDIAGGGATPGPDERLRAWIAAGPTVEGADYAWTTEDEFAPDGRPVFGAAPHRDHVFVAAGLGRSPLTWGTVAGLAVAARIAGDDAASWERWFRPARDAVAARS